jgi:hypothetical protein
MELTTLDILILFTLAIAISLVIAINVIYVVDKKLNDIQIKIPTCPKPYCPRPICPSLLQSNSNSTELSDLYKIQNKNISEHFNNDLVEPPDRDFASKRASNEAITLNSYADQIQHKLNDKKLPKSIAQIHLGNPSIKTETQKFIQNESHILPTNHDLLLKQGYKDNTSIAAINEAIERPIADDIVSYNDNGCYNHVHDNTVRNVKAIPFTPHTCRPYTDAIVEGDTNTIKINFTSPMSNRSNAVKSTTINFYVPKLYMGRDPYISGISYASMHIEEHADIDQVGSIPLNDYDGEPIPVSDFAEY